MSDHAIAVATRMTGSVLWATLTTTIVMPIASAITRFTAASAHDRGHAEEKHLKAWKISSC
jgi:hypothetical protein